jgi:hypothetical protein
MTPKTRKVLSINENGLHLECIRDDTRTSNRYGLYRVWWDQGDHRKLIVRYEDFNSILWHIAEMTILNRATRATIDR